MRMKHQTGAPGPYRASSIPRTLLATVAGIDLAAPLRNRCTRRAAPRCELCVPIARTSDVSVYCPHRCASCARNICI